MSELQAIKLELYKIKLIKALLATNEQPLLEQVEKLLFKNIPNSTPILSNTLEKELGYWLNGKAVDEKSLLKRLEQADEDRANGRLRSHESFQKEAENW